MCANWFFARVCVFPGDDQRGGVALHCHPGPTSQHLRWLLADGVGAGGQRHRHGYRRGGTPTHEHTRARMAHAYVDVFSCELLASVCEAESSPFLSSLWNIAPSSSSKQEGGRSKSHRYWPKLGSKHNSATHGKFKVTTKFRTDSGCYATTGLKVKHLLSGQERTVWHLQYTDWPEQGCPEYVQGFLCKWGRVSGSLFKILFHCFIDVPAHFDWYHVNLASHS